MSVRKLVTLAAAFFVVVSVSACGSLVQSDGGGQGGGDQGGQREDRSSVQPTPEETTAAASGGQDRRGGQRAAAAPDDPTLSLSIPKIGMDISNIPTGRGDDLQLLEDNGAVHVYPTGFPWQDGANVFLAGHVEGYRGTPSYKAFAKVKQLENGDEITVTDANGKRYTYSVYEKRTVTPQETEVLNPVAGKDTVTLQTCELVNTLPDGTPDYSNTDRLIVRGELQS